MAFQEDRMVEIAYTFVALPFGKAEAWGAALCFLSSEGAPTASCSAGYLRI